MFWTWLGFFFFFFTYGLILDISSCWTFHAKCTMILFNEDSIISSSFFFSSKGRMHLKREVVHTQRHMQTLCLVRRDSFIIAFLAVLVLFCIISMLRNKLNMIVGRQPSRIVKERVKTMRWKVNAKGRDQRSEIRSERDF